MRRKVRFALILSIMGALMAGCAPSSRAPMMVRTWALQYAPPRVEGLKTLPVMLRVKRLRAAYGFNGPDMVYSPSPLQRATYPYNRWLAAPSDLLGDMLARDMRASGLFHGVLGGGDGGEARFLMQGGVLEAVELNRRSAWSARLALHITLTDQQEADTAQKVILQKNYAIEEPIRIKGAPGLARAMSRAASAASKSIMLDLHRAIKGRIK
jgi:cholesterol transport system auxiliary component